MSREREKHIHIHTNTHTHAAELRLYLNNFFHGDWSKWIIILNIFSLWLINTSCFRGDWYHWQVRILTCLITFQTFVMVYFLNCVRLRQMSRFVNESSLKTLASSFILSRLDYCNSLFQYIPQVQTNRLQNFKIMPLVSSVKDPLESILLEYWSICTGYQLKPESTLRSLLLFTSVSTTLLLII